MGYELGHQTVKLSEIRPNPVSLRTVDRKSEKYQGLVDSIRNKGFIGSISARPQVDKETGEEFLELIDGLHRFCASGDAGLETITVDVKNQTEDQVLETQLMLNIHKVETTPAQYGEQLRRILDRNPLWTEAELAAQLGVSAQFIQNRLSLNKIEGEDIRRLIDEGKITLSNAVELAKLPPEEQKDFVDMAMTMRAEEFTPAVAKRRKELRDANRKGEDAPKAEWAPVAHSRSKKELEEAANDPSVLVRLIKDGMTQIQVAQEVAKWAVHLDAESVAEQRAKHDQIERERADAKKRKEAEKAKGRAVSEKRKAKEAALEQTIAEGYLNNTITSEQANKMREELKAELDAEEAAAQPAPETVNA